MISILQQIRGNHASILGYEDLHNSDPDISEHFLHGSQKHSLERAARIYAFFCCFRYNHLKFGKVYGSPNQLPCSQVEEEMSLQMLPEYAAVAGLVPLKWQQVSPDSHPLPEPVTQVFLNSH